MSRKIRKSPPVCLFTALIKLYIGRLSLSREHLGSYIGNDPREIYTVFRNILDLKGKSSQDGHLMLVSFKFAHLSYQANKLASLIPMLLIAGFPGFKQKIYAVNSLSGHWMGIYQWRSADDMEEYKRSFVFRMMKKRAIDSSIQTCSMKHTSIDEFFENKGSLSLVPNELLHTNLSLAN